MMTLKYPIPERLQDGYYQIGYTDLFLANGFDLKAAIVKSEDPYAWPQESLVFTGNGAEENNLLQAFGQKREEEYSVGMEMVSSIDSLGREIEESKVDESKVEPDLRKFLADYKKWVLQQLESSTLHPLFVQMETKKIDSYAKHALYIRIPYTLKEIKELMAGASQPTEDFLDIPGFHQRLPQSLINEVFGTLDINDEALFMASEYQRILVRSYCKYKTISNTGNASITDLVNFVRKNVTSKIIREHLLEDYVRQTIYYKPSEVETAYKLFNTYNTNTLYKKNMDALYTSSNKIKPGSTFPKFKPYENYAGGTTSIDDFKGKYVYIDVWATWCGPCLEQIPFLEKIEAKYKDKNITFVSISVDSPDNKEMWRNMIKTKHMKGIQLLADVPGYDSDLARTFNLGDVGIPTFILIDPKGNIVSNYAPRPSDAELVELLDSLDL